MPRAKNLFRHEVKWAPDDPNINAKYGARVQSVGIKRGKITVTWSIYKAFTKGKKPA